MCFIFKNALQYSFIVKVLILVCCYLVKVSKSKKKNKHKHKDIDLTEGVSEVVNVEHGKQHVLHNHCT